MRFLDGHLNRLQLVIWLVISLLLFFSILHYDPFIQALLYTITYVGVYALVIYGNTLWLIPSYFKKRKYIHYTLGAILIISVAVFIRSYGTFFLYNRFFSQKAEVFKISTIASSSFSVFLLFVVSILFGLALDYFKLRTLQQSIKAERDAAELHLLKQQLHPHFLFNTLNNIYYVAQKESPASAILIERLSEVLRYFLEEAAKEKVCLKDELRLIEHYIELEKIRVLHSVKVTMHISVDASKIFLPPLLLLPIIENCFKHGVDKRLLNNEIYFSIASENNRIVITTKNKIAVPELSSYKGGLGLSNLKKRLALYYSHNFTLNHHVSDTMFSLTLTLPV
jgi:sensor histidine kinase YesM